MDLGARILVDTVCVLLTWGLMSGVVAFAWFKGGWPERLGAATYLVSFLGYFALQIGTGEGAPVALACWLDFAVATAYLALAVRYNSLWLGAAMMNSGFQLGLHSTHLIGFADPRFEGFNLYAVGLNLLTLTMLLLLVGATLSSMRARARARSTNPSYFDGVDAVAD